MAVQQASSGQVLVLDANEKRTADFCSRLRFLNYDPVVAGQDRKLSELSCGDDIAFVVGDIDDRTQLADAARNYRAQNESVPVIRLPDAAGTIPELDGENSWSLALPLRRSELQRLLDRAERYRGKDRRQRLTGNSPSIRGVRVLIEQVADFDTTVLITGQSGTGKELVARTIHELSDRADKPFVPINCGAIPPDLLESELFGHNKGAFTGAIAARTGRFELAEGGTLFLDEIGDMSLPMQVKILRVLQERSFERIGSGKTQKCDVRIVAATHRDLPQAVEAGDFREDLFYRLNVFPIEMPPLYKRVSDLPLLMDQLFASHSNDAKGPLRISEDAVRALANYAWPGNIRELSNLVERLAIIKPNGTITVDDLPGKYRVARAADGADVNHVAAAMQLQQATLKGHLQGIEKDLIGRAMRASDGVVAKAARLLSVRRTTLVEKIGKYEIRH